MGNLFQSSSLTFRTLLAAVATSALGGLYGCEKPALERPGPDPRVLESLRSSFESAGHDQALVQPVNDTAQVYWAPNWQAGYNRTNARGTEYTFVPLTPMPRNPRTLQLYSNFKMVGVKRFVLVKRVAGKAEFSLATYIRDTPAKQTVQEAEATRVTLTNFTGSLTLHGLSSDDNARFTYRNGVSMNPATPESGHEECINYYTCYWSSSCNVNGNYVVYGTMTGGIDGCPEPGQEACPNNWGMSWSSNGSTVDRQCYWVDDPDNPGDDPGDGSGGDNPTNNDCPDDPFPSPTLAPSSPGNYAGATFGNTRNQGTKFHGGIDIYAQPGTAIASMHGGVVVDIRSSFAPGQYAKGSFGNYVTIQTTINGTTVNIKYAHLNGPATGLYVGQTVNEGDWIGVSGKTGNAAASGIIPHVHIEVKDTGSNQLLNPEPYMGTQFNLSTGTGTRRC